MPAHWRHGRLSRRRSCRRTGEAGNGGILPSPHAFTGPDLVPIRRILGNNLSTAAVLVPSNSGNSDVDQGTFSQGLRRGDGDRSGATTTLLPVSPVQVGPATFMIGFARGSRDAQVPGLHRHAGSRPPMFLRRITASIPRLLSPSALPPAAAVPSQVR
jgi:hypothetical protein